MEEYYYKKYLKYKKKYLLGSGVLFDKKINVVSLNVASDYNIATFGLINESMYGLTDIRYKKIISYIINLLNNGRSVILLQEVTKDFLNILEKSLVIDEVNYRIFESTETSICKKDLLYVNSKLVTICSGNIRASEFKDITKAYKEDYKKCYDKGEECTKNFECKLDKMCDVVCNPRFQMIEISIYDKKLILVNVHLVGISDKKHESYKADRERRKNILRYIKNKFNEKKKEENKKISYNKKTDYYECIIVGDFNDEDGKFNSKDVLGNDFLLYDQKDIKTSFHQIVALKNKVIVKEYDDQRELLDHILYTEKVKIESVSYYPEKGIEKGKQYPYDGLDAYDIYNKNKNESDMKGTIMNGFNNVLQNIKDKKDYDKINFSDHALIFMVIDMK